MKNIRHHIEIHFLSSRSGSVNIAQTIATCIYAHCLKVLLYESELKIYFFTNFYQRSFWTNTKKIYAFRCNIYSMISLESKLWLDKGGILLTKACRSVRDIGHRCTVLVRTRFWAVSFKVCSVSSTLPLCPAYMCFSSLFSSPFLQYMAWRVVLDVGFLRICSMQSHFVRLICMSVRILSRFIRDPSRPSDVEDTSEI